MAVIFLTLSVGIVVCTIVLLTLCVKKKNKKTSSTEPNNAFHLKNGHGAAVDLSTNQYTAVQKGRKPELPSRADGGGPPSRQTSREPPVRQGSREPISNRLSAQHSRDENGFKQLTTDSLGEVGDDEDIYARVATPGGDFVYAQVNKEHMKTSLNDNMLLFSRSRTKNSNNQSLPSTILSIASTSKDPDEQDVYQNADVILKSLVVPKEKVQMFEVIDGGEFGDIFSGELLVEGSLPVKAAVKMVKLGALKPEQLTLFTREMSTMAQLNHPHVVRLLAVVETPMLIVMEYVSEGSLLTYLQKYPNPPLPVMLTMATQTAAGCTYLSSHNVVHRDLACRNVLLHTDGSGAFTCKIGDLGLARVVQSVYATDVRKAVLPVRWCAPECLYFGNWSSASDVWSFGVLVWELATSCQLPFAHIDTNAELLRRIEAGERLNQPPGIPNTLYSLMMSCWEKQAEDRPSFSILHKKLQLLSAVVSDSDPGNIVIERGSPQKDDFYAAVSALDCSTDENGKDDKFRVASDSAKANGQLFYRVNMPARKEYEQADKGGRGGPVFSRLGSGGQDDTYAPVSDLNNASGPLYTQVEKPQEVLYMPLNSGELLPPGQILYEAVGDLNLGDSGTNMQLWHHNNNAAQQNVGIQRHQEIYCAFDSLDLPETGSQNYAPVDLSPLDLGPATKKKQSYQNLAEPRIGYQNIQTEQLPAPLPVRGYQNVNTEPSFGAASHRKSSTSARDLAAQFKSSSRSSSRGGSMSDAPGYINSKEENLVAARTASRAAARALPLTQKQTVEAWLNKGSVSREAANQAIMAHGNLPGSFLIRKKSPKEYVLSTTDAEISHFRILVNPNSGRVAMVDTTNGNRDFANLEELIKFYQELSPTEAGALTNHRLTECVPIP